MILYCCGCSLIIQPRLTTGVEIYPHREDLSELNFWVCDDCGNYVGCHHKTDNPTQPLGSIPSPELREYRKKLHEGIDPIWQNGWISRSDLYKEISRRLGWKYHTANVNSLDEAQQVGIVIRGIQLKLKMLLIERDRQHTDGEVVKPITFEQISQ